MTKTLVLRLLAVSFLMLALSACGFHLRNKIALPEDCLLYTSRCV